VNGPAASTNAWTADPVAGFREVISAIRPSADAELIDRACAVAAQCHQGQTQRSGDPYITHPIAVAVILARLDDVGEVDDRLLCAAILHDTVEGTPYTLTALRRDFGTEIARVVGENMALTHLGRRPGLKAVQVTARIRSADTRVVAMRMAAQLHDMQTLQFLPRVTQLRKTRQVLDTFVPAAQQLSMHTVRSQLQTLAFAVLIRNQPLRPPRRRVIVALDIEHSTSRPDPVKAGLRTMLYELFDAALRSAGISARRRDRFTDRGDGLLALFDPADQALLSHVVVPAFSQLVTSYNAGLPDPGGRDRQLRVRVVMHTGNVHDDGNGYFGQALDIAFRLLDAPRVKTALRTAHGPVLTVMSSDIHNPHMPDGGGTCHTCALVTTHVAGNEHHGWIHSPAQAT
jgi:HD domain